MARKMRRASECPVCKAGMCSTYTQSIVDGKTAHIKLDGFVACPKCLKVYEVAYKAPEKVEVVELGVLVETHTKPEGV